MQEYAQWYDQGSRLYRSADWAPALLCYLRATRLNRHAVQALYELGDIWQRLGRAEEARLAWSDVLRWQPQHVPAHLGLARLAAEAGDWSAAAAHHARVLEREPENGEAGEGLGRAMLGLGQHEAGEARLSALLDRGPVRVAAWEALDAAWRTRGATDAARDLYLRVRPTLPSRPAVWAAALRYAQDDTASSVVALQSAARHAWADEEQEDLREILRLAHHAGVPEPAALDMLYRAYAALLAHAVAKSGPLCWPRRMEDSDSRLRLAYLIDPGSAPEAAARALEAARAHDRERFCVSVFSLQGVDESEVTGSGLRVFPVPGAPPSLIARLITQENSDILLDWVGLASADAVAVLALQPARVRVAAVPSMAPAPASTHALAAKGATSGAPLPGVQSVAIDGAAFGAPLDAALQALAAATPRAERPFAAVQEAWQEAVAAHQGGRGETAREAYRRVLEAQPESVAAHYMAGQLLQSQEERGAALEHLERAIALAPDFSGARIAAVNACLAAEQFERAHALAEEGLSRAAPSPMRAALLRLRGLAALRCNRAKASVADFRAALALEPGHGQTYFNLGVAFQRGGDRAQASICYQVAAVLDPNAAEAWLNLGGLYQQQANHAAAINCYQQVLKLQPESTPAYKNLGESLFASRRYEEWIANFREFERRCPQALPLAVYALQAGQYMGDLALVDRYLERLRKEAFAAVNDAELVDSLEELLYLLLFFDYEAVDLLSFYRTYDTAARHVYGTPMAIAKRTRTGPIRVGYLSADFREHVMGRMMLPVLEHHDRNRFEVHCYSLNETEDPITARFRALARSYTPLAALPESDAAARIAADQLDLLVDLSTHTQGARPGILALKPAPVQITHVASAGALGLSSVDFKLTDEHCDVPENQETQLEALLAMPACCYPFRRMRPAAEHPYQRARLGIAPDAVVIGAFVTLLKFSRRCLALWRDVLTRVPRATIALSPQDLGLEPYYVRVFAAAGIGRERLVFVPQGGGEEHNLARYELLDMVLDPLPFGGVNGTMEALNMGVPVVTLCGRRHGERTSTSLLRYLGVVQTIATSGKEYVDIAERLATHPEFREEVRRDLRARLRDSPLADPTHYTRALESAYEAALERTAAGRRS